MLTLEVSVTAKAMSMLIENENTIEATQAITGIRASTIQAIANFKSIGEAAAAIIDELPGEPVAPLLAVYQITYEVLAKLQTAGLNFSPTTLEAVSAELSGPTVLNIKYTGAGAFLDALEKLSDPEIPGSVQAWLLQNAKALSPLGTS